jgi:Ca2+ transporting ATPase
MRLAELVQMSDKQDVAVFRNSVDAETIDASELLVGDIYAFQSGMKIPADSIVVDGQDIECTETELTGEPDAMEKVVLNQDNYKVNGSTSTMLAKSLCTQGFGKALVLAVGTNTVAGVITESTQTAPEPTLLQKKLHTIADKIGKVGMWVALMTMIAQIIRIGLEMGGVVPCGCQNILECQEIHDCEALTFGFENLRLYNELLYTVIISITVIVVAIPEGLPLAVTISLSVSSKQMQKLNNLVRKLASSETMGGATHICSDKTGTLTMNKMTTMACNTLQSVHMAGNIVRTGLANDVKSGSQGVFVDGESVWKTLVEGVLWNSSARLEKNDGSDEAETGEFVTKGNVTEQGLIKFFMWAIGGQGTIDEKKRLLEENTLCTVSFTSARKRASIVVRRPEFEGTSKEVRVYCKGAPDMVFEDTTHVVCADGSVQGINELGRCPMDLLQHGEQQDVDLVSYQTQFDRTIKKFAHEAYRTLLITYKDMSMDEYNQMKSDNNDFAKEADRQCLERNLVAVGIFGLQDPLRDGIAQSIAKCRTAGITTIMCTGDNIDTAIAISKNAGIVTEEECKRSQYSCMTGKDFRETVGGLVKETDPEDPKGEKTISSVKDQRKFIEVSKHLKVLARSSPEDKLILVTGIQEQKGVVAVTGDGTNDAPALT